MSQDEPFGPDLVGVIADANSAGLEHVVIGGFSVIFHGYVRATRDSDLLVPDGEKVTMDDIAGAEQLRVNSRRGIIDIIRGGSPPLDFDTVSDRADTVEWEGQMVRVAALPSVVGFKRLARRPQDRVDLEELEAIHGDLPEEPIPSLDS
jgi:hypothetical protein